jgi:hypothetical protein
MAKRNISRGLLIGAAAAAGVAIALLQRRRRARMGREQAHDRADALVDAASEDSFPASDPPSYASPSRVGGPAGPIPRKSNGR